ncbi:hypothetical protein M3Y95_00322600 [Aphelenchoides besseyi]|nr:hypothetical protein M3Y95_00322600 [Aphelenchoides besseyi]
MVFLQLSDDRFALAQLSAFANSNQVYSIYEGLTVTELKSAVAERLNAQENSIQLEFNGDLLHNDETLDAYGITDNSTLIISQFLLLVESPDNEEPLSESKSEDEEETEFRSRFINLAKSPVFKKKAKRSLDCSLAEPTIGDSTKSSGQGFRLSYYKELFGTMQMLYSVVQKQFRLHRT